MKYLTTKENHYDLAGLKKKYRLTYRLIAEKSGVTQSYLSDLALEKNVASEEVAKKIIKAVNELK